MLPEAARKARLESLALTPSRSKTPLPVSLYVPVVVELKKYLSRRGLPAEVLFPPPHLVKHHDDLSDPELWPTLFGVQHDEKDSYRVDGPAGIQDWGDGEAQQVLDELAASQRAIDESLQKLKQLSLNLAPDAAAYSPVLTVLKAQQSLSARYLNLSAKRVAVVEGRTAKLRAWHMKLAAGSAAQHARLEKNIAWNQSWLAKVLTLKVRAATWDAAFAALPAVPTVGQTPASLINLLDDMKAIVEKGFELSRAPASKLLAVIYASVFECDATAVGSIAFTVDEAKIWQIREAVNRSLGDANDRGLKPVFVAADKGVRVGGRLGPGWLAAHGDRG